jgi:hypothetical protein
MTPLRLHLHSYLGNVIRTLGCVALSLVGMFMAFHAVLMTIQGGTWEGRFWIICFTLLSLAFTLGGIMGAYGYLTEELVWIEMGPRLTYRTLTAVHVHEWSDVESIQVTNTVHEHTDYEDEDGDTWYTLATSLVITLCTRKSIDLGADPDKKRDEIVRTLIEGLSDESALTRRCCAEALGRLRPDGLPNLQAEMKRMCAAQRANFEVDAVQARRRAATFKIMLRRAVPQLKQAMHDTDADVRDAASEALNQWERTTTLPLTACGDGGK